MGAGSICWGNRMGAAGGAPVSWGTHLLCPCPSPSRVSSGAKQAYGTSQVLGFIMGPVSEAGVRPN